MPVGILDTDEYIEQRVKDGRSKANLKHGENGR